MTSNQESSSGAGSNNNNNLQHVKRKKRLPEISIDPHQEPQDDFLPEKQIGEREKLPLENEELLESLVVQQHYALRMHRRSVSCLKWQLEQQRQKQSIIEAAVWQLIDSWSCLNADLIMLKSRLRPSEGELVQRLEWLLAHPEASIFYQAIILDCSTSFGCQFKKKLNESNIVKDGDSDFKANDQEESGESDKEEELDLDRLLGLSDVFTYEREGSIVKKQVLDNAQSTDGKIAGQKKFSEMVQRLQTCRGQTIQILREIAGIVEITLTSNVHDRHRPTSDCEVAEGIEESSAKILENCGSCCKLLIVIKKLRRRACIWRQRARTSSALVREQRQHMDVLSNQRDLLFKQQAKFRYRLGISPSPSVVAEAYQAFKVEPNSAENLGDSSGGMLGVGENISGPRFCSWCQDSFYTVEENSARLKNYLGSVAADSDCAALGVKDKKKFAVDVAETNSTNSAFEQSDCESMRLKLQLLQEQVESLSVENLSLRQAENEHQLQLALRQQQILQSPPYLELQRQCDEQHSLLVSRVKEVEDLRRELLLDQGNKDKEFERLVVESKTKIDEISNKYTKALENVHTLKLEKEISEQRVERTEENISSLRALREAEEIVYNQRSIQLSKLKLQFDKLKDAGNQMLERNMALKKDKQLIIEALKNSEVMYHQMRQRLVKNTDSGAKSAVRTDGSDQFSEDDTTEDIGMLKIELAMLRRRLEDYAQLEAEIGVTRDQYSRVVEEVEEVSKAFEERQIHCESLLKQLKERVDEVANLKQAKGCVQQQQLLHQRYQKLHDQKLLQLKNHYERVNNSITNHLDGLMYANQRSALADQQRDEALASFESVKAARDALVKEKDKMAMELQSIQNLNKVFDNLVMSQQEKIHQLEADLRHLRELKMENEKKLDKFRAKDDKIDKKRAHSAPLSDLVAKDIELLRDENDNMRRRLVCCLCNEHFKDSIIIKCGHMFCHGCLEKNLKSRSRKCPSCKAQFDQKDIRKVYMDN